MNRGHSIGLVIFSLVLCLAFAIGSNYGMQMITKTQLIYETKIPKKIGAIYMTLNNPFYTIVNDELSKIVEKHGDTLLTLDPALSLKKQKEQMQYLIDQKVDAIVLTPVNFQGLKEELQEAKDHYIPVIVVDTEVSNSRYVTYNVSSDNYDAGVQCAKDMMERRSEARIVLLEHSSANSGHLRIQGFLDTIQGHETYQVIERLECLGQLEKAMPEMESFLQEGQDFDVLMCLNDPSALGGMAALEAMGQLEDKMVYGIDGTPEAKRLVSEGRMQATVAQSPKTMGQKAGKVLYRIFSNKKIKHTELLPVELIDQENVSSFSLEEWQ